VPLLEKFQRPHEKTAVLACALGQVESKMHPESADATFATTKTVRALPSGRMLVPHASSAPSALTSPGFEPKDDGVRTKFPGGELTAGPAS